MAGLVTYTACRWYFASVRVAISPHEPGSSRPTAVTVWFLFSPPGRQLGVARVESYLRLPGNILHLLFQTLLPLAEEPTHPWPPLVGPGCFPTTRRRMRVPARRFSASRRSVFTRSPVGHRSPSPLRPRARLDGR